MSVVRQMTWMQALHTSRLERRVAHERLRALSAQEGALRTTDDEQQLLDSVTLQGLKDRWGKAGFLSLASRTRAKQGLLALTVVTVSSLAWAGSAWGGAGTVGGAVVGLYAAALAGVLWLRLRAHRQHRAILAELPLLLESIILLVEAGMGILPALEQVIRTTEGDESTGFVTTVLRLVYRFSAHGMPFADALVTVADAIDEPAMRHVLLHLEVSMTEGGTLVPSLRSLADHAHSEWKLSVEAEVHRLEQLVVFPVFASVIGLMVLTAAVPLVPVLDFMQSLEQSKQAASVAPVEVRR
ncbi:MAG: type II secretion system F family protein [Bdellovibrionales bacterium]|nr:type II secretion system F family protein [Bdellovibrionales bacterium]